ncbi:MAG: ATP-binding protein [Variovorax sp.]|nr:MAG: ATP-binding protein [Variovorax sp.]
MSLSLVQSRALVGLEAASVTVEVHLANGLPSFTLVGLADVEVKEARERVRSAIQNAGLEFPTNKRITVNLAPADLPKGSGRLDLPIALGILAASGQIDTARLAGHEFAGELSLSGHLRPVRGALAMALALHVGRVATRLVLPMDSAREAALVPGAEVYGAVHLLDVVRQFLPADAAALASGPQAGDDGWARVAAGTGVAAAPGPDLADVKGHVGAKRALEIAAAGGSPPRPGEISLAHHGVLFLDEFPEFARSALEALREPLETGTITIARAARRAEFPARFQLIAAMNPCPCGYLGSTLKACRCTPDQVARYQGKLSGPLLDRIDLHIEVPGVSARELLDAPPGEATERIRARAGAARERAMARQGKPNQALQGSEIDRHAGLAPTALQFMHSAAAKLGWSARSTHRALKVARTIADLADVSEIAVAHVAEAVQYRRALQAWLTTGTDRLSCTVTRCRWTGRLPLRTSML